jgi:hypothetical protein
LNNQVAHHVRLFYILIYANIYWSIFNKNTDPYLESVSVKTASLHTRAESRCFHGFCD